MNTETIHDLNTRGECTHAGRVYQQYEGNYIASRCESGGLYANSCYEYTLRKTDCGTYFLVTTCCVEMCVRCYLEVLTIDQARKELASWRKKNKLPRI